MDSEARLNRTILLADGRRTGFSEIGDPSGTPVIYCHGFPGSRLESRLVAAGALRARVRIIAPDRPGYGLSDLKAKRTLIDWAADVAELADILGLARFSVVGVSGGGPYALSLAHCFPERVESVAIVCGLGPVCRPEALIPMHWPARFGFSTARGVPWLTQLVYGGLVGQFMYLYPDVALGMLTASMGEADRRTLARQDIHAAVCASLREGLRQGTRGALLDMSLYSEEWGFDPMEIAVPVAFWHGDADVTVPVSHTYLVAKGMPWATVRILPEEGHFSLPIDHADEILKTLLNR